MKKYIYILVKEASSTSFISSQLYYTIEHSIEYLDNVHEGRNSRSGAIELALEMIQGTYPPDDIFIIDGVELPIKVKTILSIEEE